MTDRRPYTDSELADLLAEWDQEGGWQLDAGKAPRLIATVRRLRAERDHWKQVAAERRKALDRDTDLPDLFRLRAEAAAERQKALDWWASDPDERAALDAMQTRTDAWRNADGPNDQETAP